jgi:hypothetical protein
MRVGEPKPTVRPIEHRFRLGLATIMLRRIELCAAERLGDIHGHTKLRVKLLVRELS